MGQDASRKTLDIYVMPGCLGYDTARHVAREIRGRGFAEVEVRLIDLSDPATVRPAPVFAVPTYLLNGRVLSLGNPDLDWLCHQLSA